MTTVITTARQTLRLLHPDDAPLLAALNADPDVMRYLPDPSRSAEEERAFLVKYQDVYRADGFARWAAIETATGAWLGWCGLRRLDDGDVDVGYRYVKSAWGRGFATEAARACVAYGFDVLGLDRIVARADAENVASVRVLAKIGLRFVANEARGGRVHELWAATRGDAASGPR